MEAVRLPCWKHKERQAQLRFLCQVSSNLKLSHFHRRPLCSANCPAHWISPLCAMPRSRGTRTLYQKPLMVSGKLLAKYSSQRICRDSEWQDLIVSVRVSIASNRVIARERRGRFGGMRFSVARQSPRRTMVGAKRRGRRADWRPRARLRARRDFDRQRKGRA